MITANIEVKGHTGTISFDGQFVTITRSGFLARASVGKGTKRIPLGQITSVQFKPAGPLVNGFIQFSVPGGVERRSAFGRQTNDAVGDENSVVFTRRQQPGFEQLRDAVEQALAAGPTGQGGGEPDVVDQLRRLGKLRDSGVLTADEFEAKKAELLGRL